MKTMKKWLTLLLCGAFALGTVSALPMLDFVETSADSTTQYVTEKDFLDGDMTTSVKNHNIYLDYSLTSGSPTKVKSSNYAMQASQGYKSGVYTGTGGAPRVFREPSGAGLFLNDMNQESLAFSFWLYSTARVLLTDDSAVYLGKGDGSKNSLRIVPNDGIFSQENRYVEQGWNYFEIELGEIMNGNADKGNITLYGSTHATDYNNGVIGITSGITRIDVVAKSQDNQADWYFDDFKFFDKSAGQIQDVSNELALRAAIEQNDAETVRFNYIVELNESVYLDRDLTIDFNGYKAMGLAQEGMFALAKGAKVTFKDGHFKTGWNAVYVDERAKATFVGTTVFERMSRVAIENYGTVDFSSATLFFDGRAQNASNYGAEIPADITTDGKACVIMLGNSSFGAVPDGYLEKESAGKYYVYAPVSAEPVLPDEPAETTIVITGMASGASLTEGEEYTLGAIVMQGEEISSEVVWSVEGSEKVSISETGVLKIEKGAVGATITVTATANGTTATATYTVVEAVQTVSSCSSSVSSTALLSTTIVLTALGIVLFFKRKNNKVQGGENE